MYYHRPGTEAPPADGQSAEFMKFQNVSPEMLNFGINASQNLLNQQKENLMPKFSGFWLSLRYYFSVSNSYVLNKILVLLYPLKNKNWSRVLADEFERGENEQVSRKWALPKQDVNAPDLYIPLMSFVTYALLYSLSRGMGSAHFTPDIIIQAIWRCLILQALESVIIKVSTNFLGVSVPVLDIFALTGYKYVALSINILSRMINGYLNMVTSMYTSSMLAYFILKTLATLVPPVVAAAGGQQQQQPEASPRIFILFGFGVFQLILILSLSMM